MHFCVFLTSLLSVAAIVSTAAVPKSVDIQHDCEDQDNQASPQTTIPSFVGIQSTSPHYGSNGRSLIHDQKRKLDQRRVFVPHGKDDHEKLVALCEAGFVSGCRQAIQGERAADSLTGKAPNSQPKKSLDSVLALLSCHSYDGAEGVFIPWGLFSLSLIALFVAVVSVVTVVRGRWKCRAIVQDEKRSHDV